MITLFVTVLIGIVFAYFATQNAVPITLRFGEWIMFDIPLYLVALGGLLIGFFVSSIISLIGDLFNTFKLEGKNSEIRRTNSLVADMRQKLRTLEIENTELRQKYGHEKTEHFKDNVAHTKTKTQNFFDRMRHSLSA